MSARKVRSREAGFALRSVWSINTTRGSGDALPSSSVCLVAREAPGTEGFITALDTQSRTGHTGVVS